MLKRPLAALALLALMACRDTTVRVPEPLSSRPAPGQQQAPRPQAQTQAQTQAGQQPRAPVGEVVRASAPARIQIPARATFSGGAVELLGSDLNPPQPQAGKPVTVTNYYKVNQPLQGEWHLFAHVAAVQGGQLQMMGNFDHEPGDGAAPVSGWKAGQVIADSWTLQLPAQSPPQVAVLIGFWHDDQRLPVDAIPPGSAAQTDGQGRVLAAVFNVSSGGPPPPTYTAPKTSGPMTIDGKLDEPSWQKAEAVTLVGSLNGAPTHQTTQARLLWDDKFIYVGFEVQDDDVWGTKLNHDDPIYGEEVVEIFLDADGDGRTYNELEVSPHNTTFDAAFAERRKDLEQAIKWESGMETAVQVHGTIDNPSDTDQGWTVEMKIPVANLYAVPHWPPQAGDTWRFNLYRLDYYNNRRVNEGQAFSPVLIGDFHNLPRFGFLKFAP